ncbi:hypothetical protein BJX62DRAFT_232523 [Aspergillus germanicus]
MSCGKCYNCKAEHPAYCVKPFQCNSLGEQNVYYNDAGRDDVPQTGIPGSFFGQSSFSSRATVESATVVNLDRLGVTHEDLQILPPLGCGVEAEAVAFINLDEVAVLGVSGVGKSAAQFWTIIAIDNVQSCLQMAESLDATHPYTALEPLLSGLSVLVLGWRWSIYESMWASSLVLLLMFFFLPETSALNILLRRAQCLRKVTRDPRLLSKSERDPRDMNALAISFYTLTKPFKLTIKDTVGLLAQV